MDFSLSDTQAEVRDLAGRMLRDQTKPERLRELERSGQHFDAALWRQLGDAGLLGIALQPGYGGSGLGFDTLCLLIEEAGRTVAPLPILPVLVSAALPLQAFAGESLKAALLPGIARGELLITAALPEPGAEPGARATPHAGAWRLDGSVSMVPMAAQAGCLLLPAASPNGPLIACVDTRAEGLSLVEQQTTTGETVYRVDLQGLAVGDEAVVAVGERAETLLEWAQQHTLAALAAASCGLCDEMMRMTARYTSEREQFGVPVATFQAVSHRAANGFVDVMALRAVTEQAVALLSEGQGDATEAVAIAKIWCGDVLHRLSHSSQHLHGGIGVDRDYPLHRYCLWAKQLELTLGGSSAHLARLGDLIADRTQALPANASAS